MAQGSHPESAPAAPPMRDVRAALREDLTQRGFQVASDTLGARSELYIIGESDLASALFEFKASAREAVDTMYQGSWVAGLPPRFAVLPADQAADASVEMLEQMRVVPLFFQADAKGRITFPDLDRVLAENVRQ